MKTKQATIYSNTYLGFSLTFPANWYIPASSTSSAPIAYGCPYYECSEVLGVDFGNSSLQAQVDSDRMDMIPYEILPKVVPNATVLKEDGVSPSSGGWIAYWIFFNSGKTFFFTAKSDSIAPILSTIHELQGTGTPTHTPLEPHGSYVKTNQGTVYTNTVLGFSLTFPANWYIPASSTDSDPHAYGCPYYECTDALEVNFEDFGSSAGSLQAQVDSDRMDMIPYEILPKLVPNATVLKEEAPPAAEGWVDSYWIFFNSGPIFQIYADGNGIMAILPSLKPFNK